MNYYVDSNQEEEFEENEFLYDDLDIDEHDTEQFVVQSVVAHTEMNNTTNATSSTAGDIIDGRHHSTSSSHSDTRSRHRSSTNSDEVGVNLTRAVYGSPYSSSHNLT